MANPEHVARRESGDIKMQQDAGRPLTLRQCAGIVSQISKMPDAFLFLQPVTGVPDYSEIVTQPMDLGTIRAKQVRATHALAVHTAPSPPRGTSGRVVGPAAPPRSSATRLGLAVAV